MSLLKLKLSHSTSFSYVLSLFFSEEFKNRKTKRASIHTHFWANNTFSVQDISNRLLFLFSFIPNSFTPTTCSIRTSHFAWRNYSENLEIERKTERNSEIRVDQMGGSPRLVTLFISSNAVKLGKFIFESSEICSTSKKNFLKKSKNVFIFQRSLTFHFEVLSIWNETWRWWLIHINKKSSSKFFCCSCVNC